MTPPAALPAAAETTAEAAADPILWPLTPLQRALTAVAELAAYDEPATHVDPYVGTTLVDLTGPLDVGHLDAALDELLTAHPTLRAGFAVDDGLDPVQFVLATVDRPALAVRDVVSSTGLDALVAALRDEPFDVVDPPLVRFALARTAPDAHVLVVVAHHLVLDGWSMPLLVREVGRLYAERLGASPAPAPARGRFEDHLAWLGRQDDDSARRHWAALLPDLADGPGHGLADAARWPHPDAASALAEGARGASTVRSTTQRLDAAVATALGGQARALGTTPATLVRAAWGLTVAGHAGAPGATVAVPVAVRGDVEHADEIVGMLTETVVARVDAAPGTTLAQVVAEHAATWAASLAHQHVGLRGIRAGVGPEVPLAGTLVAVEADARTTRVEAGPLVLAVRATHDATQHPLALTVTTGGTDGTWTVTLDADDDVVPAPLATAVLAGFVRTLARVATDPGARVADLDLVGWFGTGEQPADAARPPLVTEVLAASVARTPEARALVVGERSWTFAQLDADVRAAEHRLVAAGARTGDALAVDLPRDERAVHAILAGLRRGLAVTPLPHGAAERREHVLRISRATVLWDEQGPRALPVADDGGQDDGVPGGPDATDAAPDLDRLRASVGSIIFTSGSTGAPKGVAVGQDALAHLLARHRTELYPDLGVGPAAGADVDGVRLRVAHTAAFSFDAHFDAFLALVAGHELHLLDEDVFLDPVALREHVERERIDYLDLTPTVWGAMLASGWDRLPRLCVVGGEAFAPALWTRMRELAARSGSTVLNLYGPTEATVDALAASVTDSLAPVVGHPVGATRAFVLDAALREVPAGTTGELHLAGPQLAEAYLGQPGLTSARFVACPDALRTAHRLSPGARMYRTGDLAVRAADGTVTLLGRNDDQISLHGFRIEPGEVEQALVALPGVAAAAVGLARHPHLGDRLVAWVVAAEPAAVLDPEALRAGVAERLARHLVPSASVQVAALPLTPNGKLDARALPDPFAGASAGSGTADHTRGLAPHLAPHLATVLAVVERVLGSAVGPDESFFAAGGDSIDALQLVAGLRRDGLRLSPVDLFAARTPRGMAARTAPLDPGASGGWAGRSAAGLAGDDAPLVPLTPAQAAAFDAHVRASVAGATRAVDVLPLTPPQLGMVVDAEREAEDAYRTTTHLLVRGASTEHLRAAVDDLLVRHPHLRGAVLQHDLPAPVLVVPDAVRVPTVVVDVDAPGLRTADDVTAHLADRLAQIDATERRAALDLAVAPLVTLRLVRTEPDVHVVVLAMHHLLTDGWSLPVLASDLADLAAARAAGDAARTAALTAAGDRAVFRDHLRWLAAAEARRPAHEALWRDALAGARPTLVGGAAAPAAAAPTGTRTVHDVPVDAALLASLAACAQDHGATLSTVVHTAWALVVGAVTGRDDVVVGTTVAGRPTDLDGADEILGMFVTTSPVRVRLTPSSTLGELAAEVQAHQAALLDSHHLGLAAVTRLAASGGGPLFDTLVVVESYPLDERTTVAGGVEVTLVGGDDATHHPVTLTVVPALAELTVEVRDGLVPDDVARSLAPALAAVLRRWAAAPADRVAAVTALAGRELPTGFVAAVAGGAVAQAAPAGGSSVDGVPGALATVRAEVARVLGLVDVAPDDDFFALGGDSISAMQLVGALRGRGLVVTAGTVFRERTPGGVAAAAVPSAAEPDRGDVPTARNGTPVGLGTGGMPDHGPLLATPALAWLREHGGDARGFVQLRTVRTPADLDERTLRSAVDGLVAAHGALRLVVGPDDQHVLPVDAAPGADLRVLDGSDAANDAVLRDVVGGLDPATGRVLGAVWDRPARALTLVAHHVAVDAVSWRIVVDDLRAAVEGRAGAVPATNLLAAAQAMHAEARARAGEAGAWLAVRDADAVRVATRPLDPAVDTVGSAREVVARLDPTATADLLAVGAHHRTDHVLLAALARAAADVLGAGAEGTALVVEAEGHGRRGDDADLDLSSTVGWFTVTWPARIVASSGPAAEQVRAVAAQVGPDGRTYGLLRHLLPETAEDLRAAEAAAPAQVLVNYLGREGGSGGGDWSPAGDAAEAESALGLHADLALSHPLELNAYVVEGADGPGLVARWLVAPAVADDVAQRLVASWTGHLRALAAGLVAEVADGVPAEAPATRAGWPMTAVQRGMVFHARTETSDAYASAVDLGLEGPLDVAALREAAADVLAAHPQLRLVVAGPQDAPRLEVTDVVDVPFRTVAPADADGLLARELSDGFDLAAGPLVRIVHVPHGPRHRVVVVNHHVVLDGWSVPLLVDALLGAYVRRVDGSAAPRVIVAPDPTSPAARLAERLRPLAASGTTALGPWVEALAGAPTTLTPTPADAVTATTGGAAPDDVPATLATVPPGDVGRRLGLAARAARVTPADLVMTAWGLVLGALTGQDDVLFGTTVAGRPPEVEGADAALGMFVNTVPVRVRSAGHATLAGVVREVHERQASVLDVDHVGLADVQRALGRGTLFDTLVVVENYPRDPASQPAAAAGLRITDVDGDDRTHYPLALTVDASQELHVQLDHLPAVGARTAGGVLDAVVAVLGALADDDAAAPVPLDAVLARVRGALGDVAGSSLPAPDATGTGGSPAATGPDGDPATQDRVDTVRRAFADVLGLADVDADENYFALGGDSIVAMRLTALLRERGWTVDPRSVFTHPTPAGLAARLTAPTPAHVPAAREPAAPASPLLDLSDSELDSLDDLLRNL